MTPLTFHGGAFIADLPRVWPEDLRGATFWDMDPDSRVVILVPEDTVIFQISSRQAVSRDFRNFVIIQLQTDEN